MRLQRRWNGLALAVGAWAITLGSAPAAQPLLAPAVQAPALMSLRVFAHPGVPDLQCASLPRGAPSAAAPDQDPREIPDDDEVQAALKEAASPAAPQRNAGINTGMLGRARPGEPYRVAIWGDSHLAAGFFTQELVKVLKLAPAQVRAGFIPANMNRPGVRLPLRKM